MLDFSSFVRNLALLGITLISASLSGGCSPLSLLNATGDSSNFNKSANHAYGPDPRQQLDLYNPTAPSPKADVVIFFYGGRWQSGEKAQYRFVANALTARGIITVIPDYRLYPQADWRDFITDAANVYRWVEVNISAHGGNPRRIFIMGHSAGAHLAAMVTLNQKLRDQVGSRITPCAMIGLAGPYDFLPIKDVDVQQVFKSAIRLMETQPIYYVDRADPPLLLLTGTADKAVMPGNSDRLASALQKQGGNAHVIKYPGVGHIAILTSLTTGLKFLAPTLQDTTDFIRKSNCNSKILRRYR